MRAGAIAILVAIGVLMAGSAGAKTQASLPDIEDEVMCPICGTLLELSDSPQAERERSFIRARIDRGQSKEEIKDALVDEFGPEVLATPGDRGFDLSAWVVPALGLLLAATALGLGAWRLARGPAGNREPEPLSPEESARLERDISSHEPL